MKVIREAKLEGAGYTFVLTNREDEKASHQSYLTDLSGFYGGVSVNGDDTQRQLGHGQFPTPSKRTGREMTLNGVLTFDTEQLRSVADRFVSGLLWDGEFGSLTVRTDDLVLSSTVRLAGEIKPIYIGQNAVEVEIPLTAPDPFLYAPARTYQIYPAGTKEGLRYPLFSTAIGGAASSTVDLANLSSDVTNDPATITPENGKTVKITAASTSTYFGWWGADNIPAGNLGTMNRVRVWVFSNSGNPVTVRVRHNNTATGATTSKEVVVYPDPGEWSYADTAVYPNATTSSVTLTAVDVNANEDVPLWLGASLAVGSDLTPVLDYGETAPSSGVFTNMGNARAYPMFIVNGAYPQGFRITSEGRTLEYPAPVVPSEPVIIDNKRGSVMVGGVDQTRRLTSRQWISIDQESSVQPRIEGIAQSTGWVDVVVSDTYI